MGGGGREGAGKEERTSAFFEFEGKCSGMAGKGGIGRDGKGLGGYTQALVNRTGGLGRGKEGKGVGGRQLSLSVGLEKGGKGMNA